MKARLLAQGLKLPLLEGTDEAANRNYIREFLLRRDRETGKRHSLGYPEQFHYIGPQEDLVGTYIKQNAVRA